MLECLVVCMARDGSTSFRNNLWNFCAQNQQLRNESDPRSGEDPHIYDMGYVTDSFRLWPAIRQYIRKNDSAALLSILSGWTHRYEISHGLGFALPAVRAAFGANLKIVRVKRSQATHVRSLVNQSYIDPGRWVGYAEFPPEGVKKEDRIARPTAVDYREMRKGDWEELSVVERFEWFVEKQTRLIDETIHLFPNVLTVRTEELSDPEFIWDLGRFINPNWRAIPDPVQIQEMGDGDLEKQPNQHLKYIEQVWQQFDLEAVYRDPAYAMKFYLDDIERRFSDDPEKLSELLDVAMHKFGNARNQR